MAAPEVLIAGGGLAGLCCARRLNEAGVRYRIIESANTVGGRVGTEEFDGFLLDRGFQVLLTAYPEAGRTLDYDELQLKNFEPGALVRFNGRFHRFADPWRMPQHLIETALSPVASLADKLRVARLKRRISRSLLDQLYLRPETTTLARLQEEGFSSRIIEHFFRPFMGGVFLENELNTSSRKFDFVFQMFAQGCAALPAKGMGAIAAQLAGRLPTDSIRTNAVVASIDQNRVRLASGEVLDASRIVLACERPVAAKLLGEQDAMRWHGATCFYFAADKPPVEEPVLVLNGEGSGVINNLCVPSQVAAGYAPPGSSLISATVLGTVEPDMQCTLQDQVLAQLREWFGSAVDKWRHLKSFRIPFALPCQYPPALTPVEKPVECKGNLFRCGDYLDIASIQGAMLSGRRAADAVLKSLA